jgi:phage terminase large subunit-like protein
MKGDCVWPERFNEHEVNKKQSTVPEHEWMSQNMLVPWNMTETVLDPNLLVQYEDEIEYIEANGEAMLKIGDKRMMSASAFWDVSSGRSGRDRSVLAIVYTDGDGHYYIHKAERLEGNIDLQVQKIKALAIANILPAVTVETNGVGIHATHILRKELKGTGIAVLEAHQSVNKQQRIIEAYQAALSAKYIHVHKKVYNSPFRIEMREFSLTSTRGHDDYIDAVASAMLREPVRINAGGLSRFKRKTGWGNYSTDSTAVGKYDPFSKKSLPFNAA